MHSVSNHFPPVAKIVEASAPIAGATAQEALATVAQKTIADGTTMATKSGLDTLADAAITKVQDFSASARDMAGKAATVAIDTANEAKAAVSQAATQASDAVKQAASCPVVMQTVKKVILVGTALTLLALLYQHRDQIQNWLCTQGETA